MLGFANSSRVQIDRDPTGALDWESAQTKGEAFKATLMGGMWPDDDELRLLVVGMIPGSDEAIKYIQQLIPDGSMVMVVNPQKIALNSPEYYEVLTKEGWDILRKLVLIMPAFNGSLVKSIFVKVGTPMAEVQDVKAAATNPVPEPKKISFDMWRIQVDMRLLAAKYPATDTWFESEIKGLDRAYQLDLSPDQFVESWIHNETQHEEEITVDERTESKDQATPTGSDSTK